MIGLNDRDPDRVSLLPSLTEPWVTCEARGVDVERVTNSEDVFAGGDMLLRYPAGAVSQKLRAVEWNGESHWPLPVWIQNGPSLATLPSFSDGWIRDGKTSYSIACARPSSI